MNKAIHRESDGPIPLMKTTGICPRVAEPHVTIPIWCDLLDADGNPILGFQGL